MRRPPLTLSAPLPLLSLLLASAACDRGGSEPVSPEPTFASEPVAADEDADADAPMVRSEWSGGTVKGIATRAPGTVDPPVGSTLLVMLWGGEYDSKVVVQRNIQTTGPSPWAFELTLDEAEFNPAFGYGVSMMVNDPDDNVWFATKPVAVWRAGEPPRAVELTLDPMDPRAAANSAP